MASHQHPLRLLVAGIAWPPETFLGRLIDGLADAGVAVTVGSPTPPRDQAGRVEWLPMPSWNGSAPRRLMRLAGMTARALVRGREDVKNFGRFVSTHHGMTGRLQVWTRLLPFSGRRWDVIYFPWNSYAISHLPVFDLGCPVVVSCRGTQVSVAPYNPERSDMCAGLRSIFERAAAVHCVSEATLKDACDVGLDSAKATIIRPAVDPEKFCPALDRTGNGGVFSVITVGTLIWVKGYEWALQAIRQMVDDGVDVRFDIIGDGPDRQRVLYTIADLGLEKQVRWLGKMSSGEVLRRVQQADVFLLSSLSEGISNAVLEAMACGIAVVTTDCGGMREAVTDGVEGLVVPVRDAEAMTAALLRLAGNPGLRQQMGRAARARVQAQFSLSGQIAQWLELFDEVLAGTPLSGSEKIRTSRAAVASS